MKPHAISPALVLTSLLAAMPAWTESFSNITGILVDFPAGAISFADEVVEFSPGLQFNAGTGLFEPLSPYRNGANTLGAPDMSLTQSISCFSSPNDEDCGFASLGTGGSLTVRFTDNLLRGGGTADPDLWIFDMGTPDDFYLDISADGSNWLSVGTVGGVTGIDIDAFGYGVADTFGYVRLRDAPGGQPSGATVGADIDAIGAISTTVVPLPATGWLLVAAIATLARRRLSDNST